MNILAPVSSIMTSKLITVNPENQLLEVRKIFDEHSIHHIPVVRFKKIVGIISKTDLLYFLKGMTNNDYERMVNDNRLKNYTAQDIMTTGIAHIASTERIAVALKIFKENLFHAIPIIDDDELVGIVTTYDIIVSLLNKKVEVA